MGACATKPKAEGAEVQMPEPAKEDSAGAGLVADSKVEEKAVDVVAVEEADGGGYKEIVHDDKVDDQSDRRRSLSHLFRENEEESTAKIEPESEKLDSSETVKTIEEVEKKLPEVEQPFITQNKEIVTDNVMSSETSETEKTIESGVEIVTKQTELEPEKHDSSETVQTTVEVGKKFLEVEQLCTTQNEETTIDIVDTSKPAEIDEGVDSEPETVEKIEEEPKQVDSSETVKTTDEAEKKLPEVQQPCTTQNEETVANIVILSEPTGIEKVTESGPETVTEKREQEQEKIDSSETVKTIEEARQMLPEIEQPCITQNEETVTDIVISSEPAEFEKVIESGPETVTLLVETLEKGSGEYLLVSNKDEAENAVEAVVEVEAQFVKPKEGKVEAVSAPEKPDVKSEEMEVKVVSIEEKN